MRVFPLSILLTGCWSIASAQATPESHQIVAAAATTPAAIVYVTTQIGSTSATEISAWSASSAGKLTAVSGSPFNANVGSMAVNGKYLVGLDGPNILSYDIQTNGALKYATTTNYTKPNQGNGYGGPIFFDHSGADLYNFDYSAISGNNTYQSFAIVKATSALTYLNEAGEGQYINGPLTFLGNDKFAYGSTCYHSNASITGFTRNTNGSLTQLNLTPPFPVPPAGEGYCPQNGSADPTNHLAIPVQAMMDGSPVGAWQLAVYTVNTTSGTLSTASTDKNMPSVKTGDIRATSMAPSGTLLAVAGTTGLQVFHFNGANPITALPACSPPAKSTAFTGTTAITSMPSAQPRENSGCSP